MAPPSQNIGFGFTETFIHETSSFAIVPSVGLIDWGDLNGGDAATDLACAWMVISNERRRQQFLNTYRASEELVCRAKGWAIHLGLALVGSGDPRHTPLGLAALERVVADS